MIPIKTFQEIEEIAIGGKKLASIMRKVLQKAKPGIRVRKLNELAEELIKKQGGFPSFKTVKNYHWATCININEGIVHGIPGERVIQEGHIVTVDMGMFYQGWHTDMADTILVQSAKCKVQNYKEKEKFLRIGKKAMREAIKVAKPGNRVGDISRAIEDVIKFAGYSPIQVLTGHGVGEKLHEEPQIPCFLAQPVAKTPILRPGMVLAIEVIYSRGKPEVVVKDDGWTVETEDKSLAAVFENTLAITESKARVLTPLFA